MEERIQKILSEAGFCSRRKAEEFLKAGKVMKNGRPAGLGDKADARKDELFVGGEKVRLKAKKEYKYLALYKPRGYVTTMSDDKDRKCVSDLVKDFPERVYPVGRLDKLSEGLLIMTNDGDFTNKLTHPKYHIPKTYRVTIDEKITEQEILDISMVSELDGEKVTPFDMTVIAAQEGRTVFSVTIFEGKNRQIRRTFEKFGKTVKRLKRQSIGAIKLGMLKAGTYRELKKSELIAINNQLLKESNKTGRN